MSHSCLQGMRTRIFGLFTLGWSGRVRAGLVARCRKIKDAADGG